MVWGGCTEQRLHMGTAASMEPFHRGWLLSVLGPVVTPMEGMGWVGLGWKGA